MVSPKTDFVREDCAFGERRFERKKCRLNLVGIEIDLGIQQGTSQLFGISDRMLPCELMRKELGMVFGGQFRPPQP
jgi:hypothetical protein